MAAPESKKVIYAAIVANVAIAVAKQLENCPARRLQFTKQTARRRNLRAVRWTAWDWPRGGHSTWPLRLLRAPDRPWSGGINP